MPRQPRGYREHGSIREQFVQRMTDEQARQGLSDGALAKLVSENYPMSASTIWKIKKFEPPKRVDLDESHAIALALGFDTFQDLLLDDQARHSVLELNRAADRALAATTVIEALSGMLEPPMQPMLGDDETLTASLLEIDVHADSLNDGHSAARVAAAMAETVNALTLLASAIEHLNVDVRIKQAKGTIEKVKGGS